MRWPWISRARHERELAAAREGWVRLRHGADGTTYIEVTDPIARELDIRSREMDIARIHADSSLRR